MLVAIDYDETYTKDPDCWNRVIATLQDAGHEVICVTLRKIIPFIKGISVYSTNYTAKRKYCAQQNIPVDIWIDDSPYFIDHDYPTEL